MNLIRKIFRPATTEPKVEVEITRNVLISGVSYVVGDRVQLHESVARQVLGSDAGLVPEFDKRAEEIVNKHKALIPPAHEIRPVPDDWQKLPECFRQWWELNEKGLVGLNRRRDIEDVIIASVRALSLPSMKGINEIPASRRHEVLMNTEHAPPLFVESEIETQRYLKGALRRAAESFAQWEADNGEKLIRLQIACGDEVLTKHSELCATCHDLANAGLQLFKTRVAPLGLADFNARSLYSHSADFAKYEEPAAPPTIGDLKLGWNNSDGPRYYLDKPVSTLASLYHSFTARDAELKKLLAEGTKELAKAQKAAA